MHKRKVLVVSSSSSSSSSSSNSLFISMLTEKQIGQSHFQHEYTKEYTNKITTAKHETMKRTLDNTKIMITIIVQDILFRQQATSLRIRQFCSTCLLQDYKGKLQIHQE